MHASAIMLNNDFPLLRPMVGWLVKRHWIHVCNLLGLLQYFLTHVHVCVWVHVYICVSVWLVAFIAHPIKNKVAVFRPI